MFRFSSLMNTIYQTGNIDRLKQLEQAINGTPKMDEKGRVHLAGRIGYIYP